MTNLADNIRVVLVETTHPGNIGATARAMKTMGFGRLFLVRPQRYPSAEATARAAGADDVLAAAVVCESLPQALRGCVSAVASTARARRISQPVFTPGDYVAQLLTSAERGHVALVFGRESSGLSNAELEYCNAILQIPTAPAFSSLNVAAAVQIICYELTRALPGAGEVAPPAPARRVIRPATAEEMDYFYRHLEQSMIDVGFLNPEQPRQLMRRLKALFNRAALDENELSILRGFLGAVQKHTPAKDKK